MFENFLNWQAQRALRASGAPPALSTQVSKAQRLGGIAKMLGLNTEMSLGTVTGDRAAMVSLIDRMYATLAPGTVRTNLVALRQFGEYAVAKGWATTVAVETTDGPRSVRQKPVTVYKPQDVELLLTIARSRDLRYWMFLTTIADTGRRVGEVLGLKWDDLRLDSETPHFDLPHTKNLRQAYVPLTTRLREEVFTPANIARLKARGNPLFSRDIKVYPFPYSYVTAVNRLKCVCDIANVKDRGYHCFRHTKATAMLARGVPLQAVSALLGHANVSTTDRLYHHATTLDYASYLE
jgi:integrase